MKNYLGRITVNPKICMGQQTIRGMRITVAFILKLMASGMTNEEILEAYPELNAEDLHQVNNKKSLVKTESKKSV